MRGCFLFMGVLLAASTAAATPCLLPPPLHYQQVFNVTKRHTFATICVKFHRTVHSSAQASREMKCLKDESGARRTYTTKTALAPTLPGSCAVSPHPSSGNKLSLLKGVPLRMSASDMCARDNTRRLLLHTVCLSPKYRAL